MKKAFFTLIVSLSVFILGTATSYAGGYYRTNYSYYPTTPSYGYSYGYQLPYMAMPTYYPSYASQSYYNSATTPVSVYSSYRPYESVYGGQRNYGLLTCALGYIIDNSGSFCNSGYNHMNDGWGYNYQYYY